MPAQIQWLWFHSDFYRVQLSERMSIENERNKRNERNEQNEQNEQNELETQDDVHYHFLVHLHCQMVGVVVLHVHVMVADINHAVEDMVDLVADIDHAVEDMVDLVADIDHMVDHDVHHHIAREYNLFD